jgi:hypothetical protein
VIYTIVKAVILTAHNREGRTYTVVVLVFSTLSIFN